MSVARRTAELTMSNSCGEQGEQCKHILEFAKPEGELEPMRR